MITGYIPDKPPQCSLETIRNFSDTQDLQLWTYGGLVLREDATQRVQPQDITLRRVVALCLGPSSPEQSRIFHRYISLPYGYNLAHGAIYQLPRY